MSDADKPQPTDKPDERPVERPVVAGGTATAEPPRDPEPAVAVWPTSSVIS